MRSLGHGARANAAEGPDQAQAVTPWSSWLRLWFPNVPAPGAESLDNSGSDGCGQRQPYEDEALVDGVRQR